MQISPIQVDRKSLRPKRSPVEASLAEDMMIMARRASEDALFKLQNDNLISQKMEQINERYPSKICGVGKCGLRAMYNVLGRTVFQEMFPSDHWMLQDLTSSRKIDSFIVQSRSRLFLESNMYYLCNHHWVCISKSHFIDDAHCWKIQDFAGTMKVLSSMEENIEDNSTTQIQCVECIRLQRPCTFLTRLTSSKITKCDVCTRSNLDCVYRPPLVGTSQMIIAKSCIECQKGHQSCVFNSSQTRCSRCLKYGYSCLFAASRQGCRTDVQSNSFKKKR